MTFSQFVVKVHSRCDLACDHCYVYEHEDSSWRGRPAVMSLETADRVAERIAEHAAINGLPEVHIILHGGEPLLAGPKRLDAIIGSFRAKIGEVCQAKVLVHTNGVRLGRSFCDIFRAHGVKVGISLDGHKEANDLHRVYRSGRSSYDRVIRGIELLRTEYPELYLGLLCTIDLKNDARTVYRSLLEHDPPSLNFLLPHATWDAPPPGEREGYADWLTTIFDEWHASGRPVPIVLFDSVLGSLRGDPSAAEAHGLDPDDVVVIETDGEIEQADSLKTAYDGAPATGLNVFRDPFEEVLAHPEVVARRKGLENLAPECLGCPVVSVCGGGMVAHRYGRGRGFANPSVYCEDLKKLITHMGKAAPPPRAFPRFDVLAAGGHAPESLAELAAGQRVVRRALLAHLIGDRGLRNLLERADRTEGACLDEVIGHPFFSLWAAGRLATGADPGRITSYAAAVAVRARLTADLVLTGSGGRFHLPTLGSFTVEGRDETAVRIHAGVLDAPGGPLRRTPVLSADGFSVRLEDDDPGLADTGWPVLSRLADDEIDRWRDAFGEAVAVLRQDHAPYLAAVQATISTLVPLSGPVDGRSFVVHRHLLGAVGVWWRDDPRVLAALLLQGHQLMKLLALQDLVELHDGSDPEFADALERAYLAMVVPGPRPDTANFAGASCLTPAGRRFVAAMGRHGMTR
ncbi:FxsB family cyclophane-forming radical SAM/SPASM peptide maturase [Actinocorallia populi]|uniref:FxsB family cyclophane-forming radical SAM/SPASM peptide maturase n=1 Tax=Actinocorallia populi TaxID=2079200 RepID=UPI000D08AF5F